MLVTAPEPTDRADAAIRVPYYREVWARHRSSRSPRQFPPATREQWRALVAKVLARGGGDPAVDPEQALSHSTYDGFDLRPLYTADDVPPASDWPTVPPRPAEGGAGWDVRQRHADPDPARANAAILADLENGATSIWLALGDGGIAIADLAQVLEGVQLHLAAIALDAGPQSDAAAAALFELAASSGLSPDQLSGTLGLDPIGARVRTGADADLAALVDSVRAARAYPNLTPITVDGGTYHDRGGSDSEEIAMVAAVAVAYIRALTDDGFSAADAFGLVECRYAVSADQFGSIAKLRAARRVWDRIGELCGLTPAESVMRQHAVTSRAMLTKRDPYVNLLRTTVACFAAATGGADVITVEPFDSAVGIPDGFGRRLARNTQSILSAESSLSRVDDPAAGSWYVESRTDQVAQAAWARFIDIERHGGAAAAVESGYLQGLLGPSQAIRANAIAHRQDVITGVSEFAVIDEPRLERPPYSSSSTPPHLWPHRYAESFEALRDEADAQPVRPFVFLAALGGVTAHAGRVDFARNLFATGGIASVVGAGELAEIVKAFVASGSKLACLCSSDAMYAEQATSAKDALLAAGAQEVWTSGEDLYPGCNAVGVLSSALRVLTGSSR